MNIAVMSFYESNSRYYHFLENEINSKNTNSNMTQLCLYPSAAKYCKKHNLNYIYIPKEVRKRKGNCNIDINKFIDYHINIMPEYKEEIKTVATQYYAFFEEYFKENNIDLLICIGEDRLFSSIPAYIFKKFNKAVLFFEPGPFGTMIFDSKGVNCNMEIATIDKSWLFETEVDEKKLCEFFENTPKIKFYDGDISAYLRKISDIILSVPPKLIKRKLPIELQTGEGFFESIIYLRNRLIKTKKNTIYHDYGKYIFLPLQVPTDVQMIKHSPIYSNFYEMIKDVYNSIPEDYKLVLREHPMNTGRYNKKIYEFINENENVFLDNSTNIDKLIKESEIVVVNNSTVGVEALKFGKTVLTLGKTYYPQVVYTLNKKQDLKDMICIAINNKIPRDKINKYLYVLYTEYLIKDHYKNKVYNNLDLLANKIHINIRGQK